MLANAFAVFCSTLTWSSTIDSKLKQNFYSLKANIFGVRESWSFAGLASESLSFVSCGKAVCINCDVVDLVDTPVAKGWVCFPCLGSDTEVHRKLKKFSDEHDSHGKLISKYTQKTLF